MYTSSPALWNGNFVKFLKNQLNLADSAYILTGSVDPSSTAVDAPTSSLYLQNSGASANLFVKQDNGSSTNWELMSANTGTVIGPFSSTATAITRFADTTGKTLENSSVLLDNLGNITGVNTLTVHTIEALTTVTTGDNIIVLNDQVTGTPTLDAGIEVIRGTSPNAEILWNESSGFWTMGTIGNMVPIQSGLTFSDSIVNTAGTVALVNDNPTPSASSYYGTDTGGTLGYFSLPAAASFADSLISTAGTVTLKNDSVSPTALSYYGTNNLGTLGYFTLPVTAIVAYGQMYYYNTSIPLANLGNSATVWYPISTGCLFGSNYLNISLYSGTYSGLTVSQPGVYMANWSMTLSSNNFDAVAGGIGVNSIFIAGSGSIGIIEGSRATVSGNSIVSLTTGQTVQLMAVNNTGPRYCNVYSATLSLVKIG